MRHIYIYIYIYIYKHTHTHTPTKVHKTILLVFTPMYFGHLQGEHPVHFGNFKIIYFVQRIALSSWVFNKINILESSEDFNP